jgi:hypothetical protein
MAKRPTPDPPSRKLTPDEQRAAVSRLESRIKEIEELDTSKIERGDDPSVQAVEARTKSTLANIFGEASAEYRRLRAAADLDATVYVLSLVDGYQTPPHEVRAGVERGKQRAIALLRGEVDALKESIGFALLTPPEPDKRSSAPTDKIFLIHGRDDAAKAEVARVIERAGLKAIILHEQPHAGKTIIEKFEKYGTTAGFAIAIVTPDDLGGPSPADLNPRARQNASLVKCFGSLAGWGGNVFAC